MRRHFEDVRNYAAELVLERQRTRLERVWREAWTQACDAENRKACYLHEEPAGIDLGCYVDADRLAQVFRNIFENSMAACPDPVHITISAGERILGALAALRVSVRDNGPGFSPEEANRVFEAFYTTKTRGIGLGMAISKRIVEAHGGTITASDSPQGGAEIILTLPREAP